MLKLGINAKWVHLSMETVTIASYSMLINGEPKGFVTPSQGIRQGNLLSPYFFLLCVKGLSSLIRKAVESQNLHGILTCSNGVCVSYLLFADDSFIFCQTTMEECQHLLTLLECYESASSQAINRQKKNLLFSLAKTQGLK